jgi:hypothetical protein
MPTVSHRPDPFATPVDSKLHHDRNCRLLCSPVYAIYPFMGCPALPLELRRHRLTLCFILALQCPQHGEMRAAVPRVPEVSYRCPRCRSLCGWTLLGAGGTHRQLPFWDELDGPAFGRSVSAFWRSQKGWSGQTHSLCPGNGKNLSI